MSADMTSATVSGRARPAAPAASQFGGLLKTWRQTRRVSQLELSSVSGVSTRHLSFIETGRAKPSRDMVLRLAHELDVPLREQNALLVAAGFAPEYAEHTLDAPEMAPVRRAIELVLAGHMPYPAVVVDSRSDVVRANPAMAMFVRDVAPELASPTLNMIRLTLHPKGLAPRLLNHAEVRDHLLQPLRRRAAAGGDPRVAELLAECEAYPCPEQSPDADHYGGVVVPVRVRHDDTVLSFFSTIATFGTAVDLTVAELSLETFFPADEATAAFMQAAARG